MLLISEAIGDVEQTTAAPSAHSRAESATLRIYAVRIENSDV